MSSDGEGLLTAWTGPINNIHEVTVPEIKRRIQPSSPALEVCSTDSTVDHSCLHALI